MGACEEQFLPDQTRWTHEDKVTKAKVKGVVNRQFFDKLYVLLNALATQLHLADARFLFALSSLESGWLDEENDWLNNPFGMTSNGKDNLGFNSLAQATSYWKCKYADKVEGAATMERFISGLKSIGYNTVNASYYDHDTWDGQLESVTRWGHTYGYEPTVATADSKGIVLLPGHPSPARPPAQGPR
jgi:hypothetical protein